MKTNNTISDIFNKYEGPGLGKYLTVSKSLYETGNQLLYLERVCKLDPSPKEIECYLQSKPDKIGIIRYVVNQGVIDDYDSYGIVCVLAFNQSDESIQENIWAEYPKYVEKSFNYRMTDFNTSTLSIDIADKLQDLSLKEILSDNGITHPPPTDIKNRIKDEFNTKYYYEPEIIKFYYSGSILRETTHISTVDPKSHYIIQRQRTICHNLDPEGKIAVNNTLRNFQSMLSHFKNFGMIFHKIIYLITCAMALDINIPDTLITNKYYGGTTRWEIYDTDDKIEMDEIYKNICLDTDNDVKSVINDIENKIKLFPTLYKV
jgi:hypothetical protein